MAIYTSPLPRIQPCTPIHTTNSYQSFHQQFHAHLQQDTQKKRRLQFKQQLKQLIDESDLSKDLVYEDILEVLNQYRN